MRHFTLQFTLRRWLLSTVLTAVVLFSSASFAEPWKNSIKYTMPETGTEVFIGFADSGADKVFVKENGKDWESVAKESLTNVWVPSDATFVGEMPARSAVKKLQDIKYVSFMTTGKYGVISPKWPVAMAHRPPGIIQNETWNLRTVNSEKILVTSVQTDQGAETRLTKIKSGASVRVSETFNTPLNAKADAKFIKIGELLIDTEKLELVDPSLIEKPVKDVLSSANQSETIEESKITVSNSKNEQVNAWEMVSPFVRNLFKEPQLTQKADETSLERIRQIFRNLVKREVGSVKILGPPGTGKTYLIKLLIRELLEGKGPEGLRKSIFLQVDPSALSAGTTYVGALDTKINAMLALSRKYPIVWVIDEAHLLRGMGSHSTNSNDVMQGLKPGLTEGYFRMIAMSTDHEWNTAFASDPALDQRFGEVKITEPSGEALRMALRSFADKHSFPAIDDASLEAIIRLSSEFNATGAQPRKGTLLIEEVFADQQLDGSLHTTNVTEVKTAAQRLYNLNPDHFDQAKMQERLKQMPKVLSESVIGQDLAKQEIVSAFMVSMAGLEDKGKPKGRKMLAGPRGQGKTELVKAAGVAAALPINRIVMTTYTNPAQTEDLKRTIAQAMRRQSNSILFFDEIEKAHPSIQKDLLDLLDSGTFSVTEAGNGSAKGISVDINVRNAYVFMATNAGADYISSLPDSSHYKLEEMREAMHKDGLNELVLDRMDGVIPFFYLSRAEYQRVVIKQIRSILETYKTNNPERALLLENLRGFISQIVQDTYREKMSNREALVALSSNLRVRMANAFVAGQKTVQLPGARPTQPVMCRDAAMK